MWIFHIMLIWVAVIFYFLQFAFKWDIHIGPGISVEIKNMFK